MDEWCVELGVLFLDNGLYLSIERGGVVLEVEGDLSRRGLEGIVLGVGEARRPDGERLCSGENTGILRVREGGVASGLSWARGGVVIEVEFSILTRAWGDVFEGA